MKKIITGLFAIAVFTFSTAAQNQNNTEAKKQGYHKGHNGKGMEKLNLSDGQKQQIKSINEDFKNRLKTLNKDDQNYKAQKKALMQERKNKMSSVLTPEQKNQFKQIRKEHKKKGDWKDKKKGDDWKEKRKMEDGKEKVKVKTT